MAGPIPQGGHNKKHIIHINKYSKEEKHLPEKTFSANLSNKLLLPTPTKYNSNQSSV